MMRISRRASIRPILNHRPRGQAMVRAVDPNLDRAKLIPVTDLLIRRLPLFESTAGAARELERACHMGCLTRLYVEQVDRPEFALASLFLLDGDELRRVAIKWSAEDERARITALELEKMHREYW